MGGTTCIIFTAFHREFTLYFKDFPQGCACIIAISFFDTTTSYFCNSKLNYPEGGFQKRFSRFCPLRAYHPPPPHPPTPTPLTDNHFAKKTLSGKRGYTPPLTESSLSFSGNFFPKRTKNDVFGLNKVKNGPKRPYDRPKKG